MIDFSLLLSRDLLDLSCRTSSDGSGKKSFMIFTLPISPLVYSVLFFIFLLPCRRFENGVPAFAEMTE